MERCIDKKPTLYKMDRFLCANGVRFMGIPLYDNIQTTLTYFASVRRYIMGYERSQVAFSNFRFQKTKLTGGEANPGL